jgi:hypothetical protein
MSSASFSRWAIVSCAFLILSVPQAAAQQPQFPDSHVVPGPIASALTSPAKSETPNGADERRAPERRPVLLIPLDVSFATLQMLDAVTTIRALDRGATEANPLVRPFTSNPTALFGVKAATAVGTIYLSERLWKRNRVAAVTMMIALNGGTAWIVARNYRLANRPR